MVLHTQHTNKQEENDNNARKFTDNIKFQCQHRMGRDSQFLLVMTHMCNNVRTEQYGTDPKRGHEDFIF